jgi:hypothetical protein
MQILTPRKYELKLSETIKEFDPKAFIIAYDPKQIYGGFWVNQVRRGRLMDPKKRKQTPPDQQPDTRGNNESENKGKETN